MATMTEKIRLELEAKRTEAASLYETFDTARKDAVADDPDFVKDKDKFEALEAKHRDYSTVAEIAKDLENRYLSAALMEGVEAPNPLSGEQKDAVRELVSQKTPGELFAGSEQYEALKKSGVLDMAQARVQSDPVKVMDQETLVKALKLPPALAKTLLTGAGLGPAGPDIIRPDIQPGILPLLYERIVLTNMVSVGTTTSDTVEWIVEATQTFAAAEVIEATATAGATGTKPEAAMTFSKVLSPVQIIAHWIPATKKALADFGQLRTIIDAFLVEGIQRRVEQQILKGNGTDPNLRGILNVPGIANQAFSVNAVEGILKGITQVRLAFLEPNAVVMHPSDFADVRLSKDSTQNYYYGPPSIAGVPQVWGLPVILTTAMNQGFALVGKFDEAILWVREGITVTATDSHSDFFVRNIIAILAEARYAFTVPRPAAFCYVDIVTP